MAIDLASLFRRGIDLCPNCETELPPASCHFYFSSWDCWGCGAHLDGRVVHPKSALRCENEWPDYKRASLIDTVHPILCVCGGRGWVDFPDTDTSADATPAADPSIVADSGGDS